MHDVKGYCYRMFNGGIHDIKEIGFVCSHGYIISNKAARKMIHLLERMDVFLSVDNAMSKVSKLGVLDCRAIWPPLIRQLPKVFLNADTTDPMYFEVPDQKIGNPVLMSNEAYLKYLKKTQFMEGN